MVSKSLTRVKDIAYAIDNNINSRTPKIIGWFPLATSVSPLDGVLS